VPRFKLPSGAQLDQGRYPALVTWTQGLVEITHDLDTGRTKFKAAKRAGKPSKTFRVLRTDDTPPPGVRRLDLGIVSVLITPESLRFRERKANPLRGNTLSRRRKF
jgi:hypothetical protein